MSREVVNRCRVCGAEYKTCYSCEQQKSWRALTDTADHYFILCTLMEYKTSGDAKKAYRALVDRGIDVADVDGYIPSVSDMLTAIAAEAKPKSRAKREPEHVVETVEAQAELNIENE